MYRKLLPVFGRRNICNSSANTRRRTKTQSLNRAAENIKYSIDVSCKKEAVFQFSWSWWKKWE